MLYNLVCCKAVAHDSNKQHQKSITVVYHFHNIAPIQMKFRLLCWYKLHQHFENWMVWSEIRLIFDPLDFKYDMV